MKAQSTSVVIPVESMDEAVGQWSTLLGVEPTFVDGDRWAQLDIGDTRLSLAGSDRSSDEVGLLIKVSDARAARLSLIELGFKTGSMVSGSHEERFNVENLNVPVTFYSKSS
ncbi:MAG: hypothetical protein L7S47_00090 [Acidimicrobiales bacterium]|jgi:hypothetical protein|nr:hypothetical protein [Acidimicrobiales bacterium]